MYVTTSSTSLTSTVRVCLLNWHFKERIAPQPVCSAGMVWVLFLAASTILPAFIPHPHATPHPCLMQPRPGESARESKAMAGWREQYAPGWVGSLVFFSPLSSSSPLLSRPLSLSFFSAFSHLSLSRLLSSLSRLPPLGLLSFPLSFYPLASAFTFSSFRPLSNTFLTVC